MTQPTTYPGEEKPYWPEEVTAADIAQALECDNLACSCHQPGANGWQTHCPCHVDQNPSFTLREGDDGKILVHCRLRSGGGYLGIEG